MARIPIDKLNEIEQRFEQLNSDMANPEIIADPERYRKITKTVVDLEDVVQTFRRYKALVPRYAELMGWKVELLDVSESGAGGYKDVSAIISGKKVYSVMKYEGGVHRVQRVPATEAQGRIHTSSVTVAVLPEADEVEVHIEA